MKAADRERAQRSRRATDPRESRAPALALAPPPRRIIERAPFAPPEDLEHVEVVEPARAAAAVVVVPRAVVDARRAVVVAVAVAALAAAGAAPARALAAAALAAARLGDREPLAQRGDLRAAS